MLSLLNNKNKIKTCSHFSLCCQIYRPQSFELFNTVYKLAPIFKNFSGKNLVHSLLFQPDKFYFQLNRNIINLTICYLNIWVFQQIFILNYYFTFPLFLFLKLTINKSKESISLLDILCAALTISSVCL